MIMSLTTKIGHHHKVTNITMSPTSLSPVQSIESEASTQTYLHDIVHNMTHII